MPEKAFESKFNQLVQNELSQKFPAAMPARVGFQLIDRQDMPDGGEKAVGVTALKVNNVKAYIPSIFRDNEIKGLDLMWLYEPDLFVPADGEWIKKLSDSGTQMTAVGKRMDKREQSSMKSPAASMIDHSFFLGGKTAERENDDFCFDFRSMLFSIPGFGTDKTAEALASPDVANPILEHLGEAYFYRLMGDCGFAKAAAAFSDSMDTEEQGDVAHMAKVMIIDGPADNGADTLSDAEKKLLMKNEVYVKDERDPASLGKLYRNTPNSSMKVPDKSGLYDLMTVDGDLRRCLVIFGRDRDRSDGVKNSGIKAGGSKVLVVCLDAPEKAYQVMSDDLFGAQVQAVSEADNKTLGRKADDSIYDIGENLFVAQPHRWLRLYKNRDMDGKSNNTFWATMDDGKSATVTVRFTGVTGDPEIVGNVLFLPLNSRVFSEAEKPLNTTSWEASSKMLFKQAGCQSLRVSRLNGGWQVALSGEHKGTMDKKAALRELSIGLGLYGGEAQMLLKEADRNGMTEYMYKEAAQVVGDNNGVPFNMSQPNKTRTTADPGGIKADPDTVKNLSEAAEKGDEDVFDLAIIKNLLNAANDRELTKDTLDELTGAMDACGRALYRMYWQDADDSNKDTEQRRGSENQLLNLFKALSEAVLDMQEKHSI